MPSLSGGGRLHAHTLSSWVETTFQSPLASLSLCSCADTTYITIEQAWKVYCIIFQTPWFSICGDIDTDINNFSYKNLLPYDWIWRISIILYNPGIPYIRKNVNLFYLFIQWFQMQSFLAIGSWENILTAENLQRRLSEGRHRASPKELSKVRNKVAEFETNFQKFVIYEHLYRNGEKRRGGEKNSSNSFVRANKFMSCT